ncbi:hypothetical protein LTR84_008641 [Exophiala bonariae]|uniref:Major facilitator superfamily (MFS) profile domain-containing protein n=1 Tax=Exophiala bonariae TaxID=1690606 RepID=A0AAV9MX66_9EURO|nr:hypothetical protein LTR84_008641 [Exophiala bonariae]
MSTTQTESRVRLKRLVNKPSTPLALADQEPLATPLQDRNISTNTNIIEDVTEASRLADETAPDGGYGWIIVAACSLLTFFFVGTTYSWGVIQDALVEANLSKASTLAFVGSLAVACNSAFAVINGRLVRAIGARKVAFLGVFLMGVGQITSGWALKSVAGLFITAGCLMGYGVSFMVVSIVPAQYFHNRRGLANGIVFAGGGLGGAVISLSMSAIVERLGTAWAFRLVGLLTWVIGFPAVWFIKERTPVKTSIFVEWKLFRDYKFTVLFLAGTVATFPLFVPPFFLPLYARSIGQSSQVGATLVAAFNFSSALGRVLSGLLSDKFGSVNSLLLSLLLSAVSMLVLWPISTSLAPLIVFIIINGMGNGGFFAIMPTVVGNVFGSARVSVAMGMMVTGWTGGYLLGAPIAGYLLEAYGGEKGGFEAYRPAIFYAGSMALGAAGLVAWVRFSMSKKLSGKF